MESSKKRDPKKLVIAIVEIILFFVILYPRLTNRFLIGIQAAAYCLVAGAAVKNLSDFFQGK